MKHEPAVDARRRSILVGMDFSPASRRALAAARALAVESDQEIVVMHVIDAHGLTDIARLAEIPEKTLRDRLSRERRTRLNEALNTLLAGDTAERAEPVIAWGKPFEELVRKAADISATLIVVGTAGHSADVERALFGSTAEKVLRAAPCPVLCVPVE